MRWWFILVVLLLVCGTLYYSMTRTPIPAAALRYPIFGSPRTLDPARASWSDDLRIVWSLWEGLTGYDPVTSRPVEGVANLPPQISADGLVYTFTLKPRARWSNGDPVTAADFVYGWRRALEPGSAGEYVFLLTDTIAGAADYRQWRNDAVRILKGLRDLSQGRTVAPADLALVRRQLADAGQPDPPDGNRELHRYRQSHLDHMEERFGRVGIRALDDHRLEVTLVRPTAYFVELLGFAPFMPIHRASLELLREKQAPAVRDLTLWAFDPQWTKPDWHRNGYPGLVSNGPYALKEWQFKRFLFLSANPHYHDRDAVRSGSVLVREIADAGSAFLAYEKGELDWIRNVDVLDFAPALVRLQAEGRRRDIRLCDAFGTYFYHFNCNPDLPDGSPNPFGDPRVRRAFSLAVNKADLAAKVKRTGNRAAYNLVPPGTLIGYHCPPVPPFNLAEARRLLAEAGYPDGAGLPTIEILFNTDSAHGTVAEAVAQMWEQNLGVKVAMTGKEMKTFDEDRTQTRYMVARAGWYGDYGDPTTFLDMYTTGNGQNDTDFSHPEYDRLMTLAAATLDPAERLAILARAEQLLIHEQAPVLPLFYYINLIAIHPDIQGFTQNAREINPLKYVYRQAKPQTN